MNIKESSTDPVCVDLWNQIFGATAGKINWYNLLSSKPLGDLMSEEERTTHTIVEGEKKVYKKGRTVGEYTPWLKGQDQRVVGAGLSDYINQPATRTALNIPASVPAFQQCS